MKWRFIMTGRCNLNCYFCMKEYCVNAVSDTLLKINDYDKILNIAQIYDSKTEITLTGGEPLMYKNIINMVDFCKYKNYHVTIVTNGILLLDYVNDLKNVSEIHVSVHSLEFSEWSKITYGNLEQFNKLKEGIIAVRQKYPTLPIRMNIVGTEANSKEESIQKYIDFANENNLTICVFREGYLDWAKQNNVEVTAPPFRHKLWDLEGLGAQLIDSQINQSVYMLEKVKIILRETSTHVPMWNSVWIDPNGVAYVDIMLSGSRILLDLADEEILKIQLRELLKDAKKIGDE